MGITDMTDAYIKFAFIAICFFIALGSYKFCHNKRSWVLLVVAMGFTVMSDFFLVILQSYYIGVLTFCFVHVAYIIRVSKKDVKDVIRFDKSMVFLFLAGFVSYFALSFIVPRLVVIGAVYAILFGVNIFLHVRYYRSYGSQDAEGQDAAGQDAGINRRIMLLGLILFALCDINVMLFNLPILILPELMGGPLPMDSPLFAVSALASTLIWVFYLPSQLLLSLSSIRFRNRLAG